MADTLHVHCRKPGLLTLIQDGGRPGLGSFGIPRGGALDPASAQLANWLVGNPPDIPVLEITLHGPELEIEGRGRIALAGADLSARVDDQPCERYRTYNIDGRRVLRFGKARAGCRAYLAIGGHWEVPALLGSYGALLLGTVGPDTFGLIRKDDRWAVQSSGWIAERSAPRQRIPALPTFRRVRVLPGPEFELLPARAIGHFFSTIYEIDPASNRMGYQLRGPAIELEAAGQIISSGVVPGTVQLTSAGLPIVLLNDAQTTGGYCRIANVATPDLYAIAQLRPGNYLQFVLSE